MKISAIPYAPTYFDTYIKQVDDLDLSAAFRQSIAEIEALDLDKLQAIGDRVYAPGKWTLRDLFQHITDCERVFAYRALRFARNDKTALPGFDENLFADNSGATRRPLETILAELRNVRESSMFLFDSFDDAAMRRTGIMYNAELPVLAVGFTLIGHHNHHFRIMEERYFPILQTA
ncbi:MAG: DinB family protein [Phycisphaerae bacterium]|nr:DinB family protein [Saprospiraceae bacterium]